METRNTVSIDNGMNDCCGGAGVQYLGHEGAVTALCILPSGGGQLVASCDSGGSCHVWSADTGSRLHRFCEPTPGQQAQRSQSTITAKQAAVGTH